MVSTVDFFPPVVDDAKTWGRIAAANAASDVYAMGGRPLFALNLVVWPQDQLPLHLLAEVLKGGDEMARQGDWQVVGGHTTEGPEPVYGQAVTGEVQTSRMMRSAGAEPGQRLVLTKPLGSGIITTAHKRLSPGDSALPQHAFEAAVTEMCRLNQTASELAIQAEVTGATDVTGFGLLGHLQEMCTASGVGAVVYPVEVPLLPEVKTLAAAGYVPGGTHRNLATLQNKVRFGPGEHPSDDIIDDTFLNILADPQTSGGLLLSCRPDDADQLVSALVAASHGAAIIGEITDSVPEGEIQLVLGP